VLTGKQQHALARRLLKHGLAEICCCSGSAASFANLSQTPQLCHLLQLQTRPYSSHNNVTIM
jgi:hypothetical protein